METNDLSKAAYLMLRGHRITIVANAGIGPLYRFIFDPAAEKDAQEYDSGAQVSAPIYADSLAKLPLPLLPIDWEMIRAGADISLQHGLLTNDAMILALMRRQRLEHLISNDDDWEGKNSAWLNEGARKAGEAAARPAEGRPRSREEANSGEA